MFTSNTGELDRLQRLLGGYAGLEKQRSLEAAAEAVWKTPPKILIFAGLNRVQGRAFLIKLLALCLPLGLLAFIFSNPYLLVLLPVVFLLGWMKLNKLAFKRAEAFEKDYTAFILSLASGVRTGLDPLVALSQSQALFRAESEIAKEIGKFNQSIERGDSEDSAVRNFAASINHPDLDLFRTAFILARKEGSSLGGCLQRLARVTRQRQSFRRKIKAAVAMQKLSAFGIAGCAVVIGIMQYVSNPDGFQKALVHPLGFKIVCLALTLICGGIVWMLALTRNRL